MDAAGKKRKAGEEKEGVKWAAPSPTEEEVEEFFAILRGMRMAVKNSGNGSGGGCQKRWKTEIAAEPLGAEEEKRENRVLDLNAAPE